MRARFYDRHTGIMGAGAPLHPKAAEVAARWEGTEGEVEDLLAELQAAVPEGIVSNTEPGKPRFGLDPSEFGMIGLRYPKNGFPCHSWRVLKYDPV